MATLIEKLVELRRRVGFSQEELADRLGVSRQTVSKWESGQGLPNADNLRLLSRLYSVSIDWLLSNEDRPPDRIETPFVQKKETQEREDTQRRTFLRGLFAGFLLGLAVAALLLTIYNASAETKRRWAIHDIAGEEVYVSPESTFSLK